MKKLFFKKARMIRGMNASYSSRYYELKGEYIILKKGKNKIIIDVLKDR